MIKFVLFDWGGTLGKKGMRDLLINGTPSEQKFSIQDDVTPIIQNLWAKGYTLGIISNTRYTEYQMRNALEEMGLSRYFKFIIVSGDICKKPCTDIFKEAIYKCKCNPREILYVGNNYEKDCVIPKMLGMHTAILR